MRVKSVQGDWGVGWGAWGWVGGACCEESVLVIAHPIRGLAHIYIWYLKVLLSFVALLTATPYYLHPPLSPISNYFRASPAKPLNTDLKQLWGVMTKKKVQQSPYLRPQSRKAPKFPPTAPRPGGSIPSSYPVFFDMRGCFHNACSVLLPTRSLARRRPSCGWLCSNPVYHWILIVGWMNCSLIEHSGESCMYVHRSTWYQKKNSKFNLNCVVWNY